MTPQVTTSLHKQVNETLDLIRPAIHRDGGDIELVDVLADGVVQVRLHGACIGCPSSAITLTHGVERTLKNRIPQVSKVVCV